jgi:hypothetical protein
VVSKNEEVAMDDEEAARLYRAVEAGKPTSEADLLRLAERMRRRIAEDPGHPTAPAMRAQLALLDRILALGRGGAE